jgi:hypothetical protein
LGSFATEMGSPCRVWSTPVRGRTADNLGSAASCHNRKFHVVGLDLVLSSIYDCGHAQTNSIELDHRMIDQSPDEVEYPSSPNNALMWYLIVSLPGTVILIFGAGYFALGGLGAFLLAATFWTIFSPGMWVFPIVFCRQVYNLASGRFVPISGNSYICAAILLGLYLWWGIATKFLINMDG